MTLMIIPDLIVNVRRIDLERYSIDLELIKKEQIVNTINNERYAS